ncbi:TrbI/VirB10 family protein [Brucella anthropi]|uniref:Type IV secretion system protein virB10 n=2 Tax=Brucella TaxID=234 RepID=A0A6L3YFA3_9HYPH|nr:type IV secretion system protein VirB10 [Brucella tritici]KAB2681164.1 TrbI/VirB10 family protein [Brucella tritici]KAB2757354.1 TrbI/VirB10 family protein [Brucella anthropi]KAB2775283.1 TrbI/VirB10 family protein [Brucella anthropi]
MMSNVDYNDLDGSPVVARKNAGKGSVLAMLGLGLLAGSALLWLNWPQGPRNSDLSREEIENFNPPTFRPPALVDSPAPASQPLEQIIVPEAKETSENQQAENVDQTVQEGADLDAQRREYERQLAEEEARRRAEEEENRRRLAKDEEDRRKLEEEEREKAMWERLRSDQIVTTGDSGTSHADNSGEVNIAKDGQIVPGADTDPNKAFLAQAELATTGIAKAKIFRRTDALIAEGTMIRGFLETAINTDLPGMVRAVVRENVYSLDGRRVLIPKGSRLTGEYRSGLARGQKRVFVVWNRVIRSDGISVDIKSPGADSLGRGGMGGRVDNHWLERYGSAILLSVVGGAAEYIASLADTGSGSRQRTETHVDPVTGQSVTITYGGNGSRDDARSIAFDKSSTALQQLAQEALRDSQQIPPTIHIDQGTPVVVFVRRDLDFSELYADPVQEELARLRRGGRPKTAIDPTPLYMTPKDNFPSPSLSPEYYPPAPLK